MLLGRDQLKVLRRSRRSELVSPAALSSSCCRQRFPNTCPAPTAHPYSHSLSSRFAQVWLQRRFRWQNAAATLLQNRTLHNSLHSPQKHRAEPEIDAFCGETIGEPRRTRRCDAPCWLAGGHRRGLVGVCSHSTRLLRNRHTPPAPGCA